MKLRLCFCTCLVLCLQAACLGEEKCGSEIKLLLAPAELQSAVAKLNAGKKTSGRVYLFDTDARDLLSQGVIVRLRQGATADLMVKVRKPAENGPAAIHVEEAGYKCELDVTAGQAVRSYSILVPFTGPLPSSGTAIFELLSPAQKRLLQAAGVSVDWDRVKRVADIQSTTWVVRGQSVFPKLSLELWQWTSGKALELSTRVPQGDTSSELEQLQLFLANRGLALDATQKLKTTLVLQQNGSSESRRSAE